MPTSAVTAEITRVFEAQRAARWRVSRSTAPERIARLERLKALVMERRGQLATALHADFRKPAAEVEATEVHPFIEEVNHACAHLADWMTPEVRHTPLLLTGARSLIQHEAKGQVLLLAPWNYPFALMMTPLVAAIAAGNVAMMRPSDKTPHTAAFMKQLVADAFPEHEVALFTGGTDVADALLDLPFDHIFFTGSPRIGRRIMAQAARHLASVTLELGGKSPAVVDATADVEVAAARIAWGKFINAGQTCVAPDHVWVHRSVAGRFAAALQAAITGMYGADPAARKATPDFARIIDDANLHRLTELVRTATEAGAELVIGGDADPTERYLAPTVLAGVTRDMPVMQEEIFGPVLPLLVWDELDEVIDFVHARGKPLAMYLFGGEPTVDAMRSRTSAGGTVVWNTLVHLANPDLPFGGVGESGQGNYHGHHGFLTFSHARAVLVQGPVSLARAFYPPYNQRITAWAQAATRALE